MASRPKDMPQTASELQAKLAEKGLTEEPQPIGVATIIAMINDPLVLALRSLASQPYDHESFARVLIRELGEGEDSLFVLESMNKEEAIVQWFHLGKRVWISAGGARQLKDRCTDILRRVAPDIPTGVFGNADFLRGVVELTKGKLDGADGLAMMDGDASRFLLRFANGEVLDYRTGEVRLCGPADRISLGTDGNY